MTDPIPPGAQSAPATTPPAWHTAEGWWNANRPVPRGDQKVERDDALERARESAATRQLERCLPRWQEMLDRLRLPALERLAANEPVDPNDVEAWQGSSRLANPEAAAQAVLHRHGVRRVEVHRLTRSAVQALIAGQAAADRDAGLDWTVITSPASHLDEKLRRAHSRLPIDLDDPSVWAYEHDQRSVFGRRLPIGAAQAADLSRWVLAHPDQFAAQDLRCWAIASPTWLSLADEQLPAVEDVERPVGVLVAPASGGEGWQLVPALSLDMIRLAVSLGGRLEGDLRSAVLPFSAGAELVERVNRHTLHAGPRENVDCAGQLAQDLQGELGLQVSPGIPRDKRDRWGRLLVSKRSHADWGGQARRSEIALRVVTFAARAFPQRRLGAARIGERMAQPSAVLDLGEAVQTAVDRGLPLLLSSEAAAQLSDSVRVGRMKGRPGVLTITTSDGLSATTERVVADQAIARLRALREGERTITLGAGARQVVRMTRARALEDDPVLLGRQKEIAALKVVGSGVDASQVGSGKTVSTGRALAHRGSRQPRFRGLIVAEGRLLGQWRDELCHGAPGRGLPPLAPNVEVLVVDERRQVAGQLRQFDRSLGERPGVVLAPNGVLDRHPADLQAITWHLLIADEALRYVNTATEAHQALAQVRFAAAADCWLLTATPRGKSSEHLDVLVGLAVGDRAMISERLNTREAGDLSDEVNAHRLRINYGPHLVRVTRQDMAQWMPTVRPAQARPFDPDPALARLLEAIRQGGREAYRRLLEVLAELRSAANGSAFYREALAELARVQGVVLGNVGVFVDASVDPETLTHSKAALAQALCRQGLVSEAMRGGGDGLPLLRGISAQTIAGAVGEEQVIVFSERVWCLRQLARTLKERHGVEAHVGDGSIKGWEFAALKQRFCAGEFPVLCLSRIGHEGHNLQNASCLLHLDLTWVPTGLEQRVGRAARPGARRAELHTYIPYIRGGGMEHVVSVLAPRGGEHHQVLDAFEGVPASESTVATQLAEITGQVAEAKDEAGYAGTAAKLRVAAAVFGA